MRSRSASRHYVAALVLSSVAVAQTSDPRDAHLQFDGIDDLAVIANHASISPGAAITVEAWIRPATIASTNNQDRVVSKTSSYELTISTGDTGCGFGSQGHVQWRAVIGGVDARICGGSLSRGVWTHVAGTYSAGSFALYVNGTRVANASRTGTLAVNGNAVVIGNRLQFDRGFEGGIDAVRIWNRALPQSELQENMDDELGGVGANLAAEYRFVEGDGQVIGDASANRNHGVLGSTSAVEPRDPTWVASSSGNAAPTVNAGPDRTLTLPDDSLLLDGSVADDGLPTGSLTVRWSQLSGPAAASFAEVTQADTDVTFPVAGTYVLQLAVNDGELADNDTVQILVQEVAPPPPPPPPPGDARDEHLQFDGIDDLATIASRATISPAAAITVEAWIKPVTIASNTNQDRVVSKSSSYELMVSTGDTGCASGTQGHVQWRATIGGVDARICGGTLTRGAWTHIAGTYSAGSFALYVNGSRVASAARNGSLAVNGNSLVIGNRTLADRGFDGAIDVVRIWSRALTQSELQDNMDDELGGLGANLAAEYPFSEGDGQVVGDASANRNQGVLGSTSATEARDPTWVASSGNRAPTVDAGPDRTLTLPTDSVHLDGTVTDDGLPGGSLTPRWSQLSGPAPAIFAAPTETDTDVTFPEAGTYVLQLSADDGERVTHDSVQIGVQPELEELASIEVLPATSTLRPGQAQQFTATGRSAAGNPLSIAPTWTTSAGSISSSGTYTAPADLGDHTVRASVGDISDVATVTVSAEATVRITGVTFNWASHRRAAPGSDNWPATWSNDDHQYAVWGDGGGFGGTNQLGRSSFGVGRIEGGPDDYRTINRFGGYQPECPSNIVGKGHGAPISIGGVLYVWVTPEWGPAGYASFTLYKSTNKGCTWTRLNVQFAHATYGVSFGTFVQYGKDNTFAPPYVYTMAAAATNTSSNYIVQVPGRVMLLRAPVTALENASAYQFYAGLDGSGQPRWSSNHQDKVPIYQDAAGVGPWPQTSFVPGLNRYVYTNQHGDGSSNTARKSLMTMAEAPNPWGPWTVIFRGVFFPTIERTTSQWNFGPKWFRNGGREFTLIFSGVSTNDSWNTVHGAFTVAP